MHHESPLDDFAVNSGWEGEVARLRSALHAKTLQYEALQTSEAYFRHLTENALDLITILEADGTIRFESRSIEQQLGYSPMHYRGRNAFEFVHPEDRPSVMKSFAEALSRQGSTPVIRFRFQHADGGYRTLEGSGNNLLEDPAVRGIVFNSRDVTEQVQLQEAIEHCRVEKEESIARLTGGVAHDFNNILTAVLGFADLTLAGLPRNHIGTEYLGEIKSAAERAALLTRQLQAISRRVILEPRSVALNPWLRDLEPRLAKLLGPDIQLTIVSNGELRVWEDPVQLEHVLLQLATNAREATVGQGRFTLEVKPVAPDAEDCPEDGRNGKTKYVQLTVADQGSGMNETTLARIFEPFFTTKTSGYHPGLGLSMCRGIVEQSGGHLRVCSHPGRGTVFHLYLPEAGSSGQQETPPPLSTLIPASPTRTVLLVDDEVMVRNLGASVLKDAGYRVLIAEDGPSALARLDDLGSVPLDLLVSDVVMPGMNGVQLAEAITLRRPGTPVLLISGYTDNALPASHSLPPGVSFLSKPFTLAGLLEKVSGILSPIGNSI